MNSILRTSKVISSGKREGVVEWMGRSSLVYQNNIYLHV